MRIIRFEGEDGRVYLGEDRGSGRAEVLNGDLFGELRPTGETVCVGRLLAPLDPVNIFCVGLIYRAHAAEANAPIPEDPVIFMKPTTAVTHPGDPIRVPACCRRGPEVDYEGELAVAIGTAARDVTEERALEFVRGYTVANDVSARRWQRHNGGQWIRGKSFDTFCPLGPALVTADEIPDPQVLPLRTVVNGEVLQEGTTADMIFPVARIVSFLSQDTTLLPGTVILTGTPPGVGFARTPPRFLSVGDRVTVEIDRIGALINPVR
ncbi:MAG: fumarylacetoacetate hydrolase family protein [Deltaproteobacteria bacterium]|nr:fumarylacetoacetate hydrolase family protein [Deltaproteobacteria bacterium]